MSDMLVKLYDCPLTDHKDEYRDSGIVFKRPLAVNKKEVLNFVDEEFSHICSGWVDECNLALSQLPATCFIAVCDNEVIGFCCYDATAKGMVGPLGVRKGFRKKGVAKQLLFECFSAMRSHGYAYAVIGWVSSESYYAKHCGAIPIPDSFPGVYEQMITCPSK